MNTRRKFRIRLWLSEAELGEALTALADQRDAYGDPPGDLEMRLSEALRALEARNEGRG